ncbi:MAG: peptidoglycan DD-metalloendopeptidase family protein [Synergistaceae bacterium]|jgi:murein DD-endopeptidase MepM/ murein hydrolase activator NlpD|nr:peptidoglycan DD-metalloendopeptidase family protein [Synergistaceae bacterium]
MRGRMSFLDPNLRIGKFLASSFRKKNTVQRDMIAVIVALSILASFPVASLADVNSPQGALDVAGIVPGRYAFAEKKQDIANAAEAAISSVRGIVDLMRQAKELNALLSLSGGAAGGDSPDALDIALKVSSIVPDFPAANPPNPPKKNIGAPSPSIKGEMAARNLRWPTDGVIYSAFGATRGKRLHGAIDIVNKKGSPIAAAADGVVSVTANGGRRYSGYGKIIIIDHGNGVHTVYAHCDSLLVKMGQRVKKGDFIGTVGRTGRATTDHVHFEVRIAGKKVDPLEYLPSRPEMVKAVNWHSPKKSKN